MRALRIARTVLAAIVCWLAWLAVFLLTLGWLGMTTLWGLRRNRFALSALLVLILWAVFAQFPPSTALEGVIVGLVGSSYVLNWAVMMVRRRRWPLRSLGIFWTIFADSVYWCTLVALFVLGGTFPAWVVPLILAAFVVGAPALDIATLSYLLRREPPADPPETVHAPDPD